MRSIEEMILEELINVPVITINLLYERINRKLIKQNRHASEYVLRKHLKQLCEKGIVNYCILERGKRVYCLEIPKFYSNRIKILEVG
jgi:hypothetical protein